MKRFRRLRLLVLRAWDSGELSLLLIAVAIVAGELALVIYTNRR